MRTALAFLYVLSIVSLVGLLLYVSIQGVLGNMESKPYIMACLITNTFGVFIFQFLLGVQKRKEIDRMFLRKYT